MKPLRCPDGILLEDDDAKIKAELSRRGLLAELQHALAVGTYCVLVSPDGSSTDFFVALYGNPHDAGLVWYRCAGMGIDHPIVQGMATFLAANAGPVVLVHSGSPAVSVAPPQRPEGDGHEA